MAPRPKSFDRSEVLNPYIGLEDQGMEMTPVVFGPPAYGSPDPATEARVLAPLNDQELGDTISEDYGFDALEAGATAGDTSGQDAEDTEPKASAKKASAKKSDDES